MHAFTYHRPATLKEAVALLKKNENARVLSGGQSLIPALKMRLAQTPALVDVNAIAEMRGIKLEADPTVIFALRDFGIRRLLTRQLAIDSPYNTYRYAGLPPGPINLPSPATIDAVLNAEQHDYLFFVVDAKFTGYHTCSKTLSEHLANARLYQQELTKRKIMK